VSRPDLERQAHLAMEVRDDALELEEAIDRAWLMSRPVQLDELAKWAMRLRQLAEQAEQLYVDIHDDIDEAIAAETPIGELLRPADRVRP